MTLRVFECLSCAIAVQCIPFLLRRFLSLENTADKLCIPLTGIETSLITPEEQLKRWDWKMGTIEEVIFVFFFDLN